MAKQPRIEFVETHQAYASDGGPRAATYYAFQVDGRQVAVEVPVIAVMTREGNLHPDKVRLAAQAFLEKETQGRGPENLPQNLLLSENEMDLTIKRLGWPARFPRP